MNKDDLMKLAKDEQFIHGIYNYCDRWCERCPFTERCLNFALVNEQFADQESRDILSEGFWRRLSETFRTTLELAEEMAETEGIDLHPKDSEHEEKDERFSDDLARAQRCCRMAKTYADMVDGWFDSVTENAEQKENGLKDKVQVQMSTLDPLGRRTVWEETLEVIRWYQHQIYVKLLSAVRGSLKADYELSDEFAKDSDGSAKVALIGIDRSIGAWGELRASSLAYEDEIQDILAHLEDLRREVEETFPAARAFIRPGFDKVHLNS